MALWLDLIPKLHRNPFQLEKRFHELNDNENIFSFEPNVTRFNYEDRKGYTSGKTNDTSDQKLMRLPQSIHPDSTKFSSSNFHRNHNHFTLSSAEIRAPDNGLDQNHATDLNQTKTTPSFILISRQEPSPFAVAIPFLATITVGLALFCCNFVMFCAVCRQKSHLQKERMLLKLEISGRDQDGDKDINTSRSSASPSFRKHRFMTETSIKSEKDDTAFVIKTRDDSPTLHPPSPSFFSFPSRSSTTSPNVEFQDKMNESGEFSLSEFACGKQSLVQQFSKKSRVQFRDKPEAETPRFESRFLHHSSAIVTSLASDSKSPNLQYQSSSLKSVTFPTSSGLFHHKIPPPRFVQQTGTTPRQQHFWDQSCTTTIQPKTRSILLNGGLHLATMPKHQQPPPIAQQTQHGAPVAATVDPTDNNNSTLPRLRQLQQQEECCDNQPSTIV